MEKSIHTGNGETRSGVGIRTQVAAGGDDFDHDTQLTFHQRRNGKAFHTLEVIVNANSIESTVVLRRNKVGTVSDIDGKHKRLPDVDVGIDCIEKKTHMRKHNTREETKRKLPAKKRLKENEKRLKEKRFQKKKTNLPNSWTTCQVFDKECHIRPWRQLDL